MARGRPWGALTHHAFSTDTDAVGIFVGTAGPVVRQLLHRSDVAGFFGLAVEVAPLVGCVAREERLPRKLTATRRCSRRRSRRQKEPLTDSWGCGGEATDALFRELRASHLERCSPRNQFPSPGPHERWETPELTVRVFVGQPVVLAVLVLEVGIALLALLRPEVLKVLRTLLRVAQLELKIDTGTVFTSVDGPVKRRTSRRLSAPLGISLLPQVTFEQPCNGPQLTGPPEDLHRIVALARSKANAGSAGPRAGAEFGPGSPVAVLLQLVHVLPHAVTFIAPLREIRAGKPVRTETTPKPSV